MNLSKMLITWLLHYIIVYLAIVSGIMFFKVLWWITIVPATLIVLFGSYSMKYIYNHIEIYIKDKKIQTAIKDILSYKYLIAIINNLVLISFMFYFGAINFACAQILLLISSLYLYYNSRKFKPFIKESK